MAQEGKRKYKFRERLPAIGGALGVAAGTCAGPVGGIVGLGIGTSCGYVYKKELDYFAKMALKRKRAEKKKR